LKKAKTIEWGQQKIEWAGIKDHVFDKVRIRLQGRGPVEDVNAGSSMGEGDNLMHTAKILQTTIVDDRSHLQASRADNERLNG
jgi:hypothetical protein